jgi:hypothetical protein
MKDGLLTKLHPMFLEKYKWIKPYVKNIPSQSIPVAINIYANHENLHNKQPNDKLHVSTQNPTSSSALITTSEKIKDNPLNNQIMSTTTL